MVPSLLTWVRGRGRVYPMVPNPVNMGEGLGVECRVYGTPNPVNMGGGTIECRVYGP